MFQIEQSEKRIERLEKSGIIKGYKAGANRCIWN